MQDLYTPFADIFGTRSVIRGIVTTVLDNDSWVPTWSTASVLYYDNVAKHIQNSNPELIRALEEVVISIRDTYRSYQEHELHVQRVPLTKQTDGFVDEKLDEECCICLRSLRGLRRVCRLRGDAEQNRCGHFIHEECLSDVLPDAAGNVRCPVCRANLGQKPGGRYIDTENEHPLF